MTQHEITLRPATPAELAQALAHALQFDERKHFNRGHGLMAEITAEHLAKCLSQGGFVVMKKPGLEPHGDPRFTGGNKHLTD